MILIVTLADSGIGVWRSSLVASHSNLGMCSGRTEPPRSAGGAHRHGNWIQHGSRGRASVRRLLWRQIRSILSASHPITKPPTQLPACLPARPLTRSPTRPPTLRQSFNWSEMSYITVRLLICALCALKATFSLTGRKPWRSKSAAEEQPSFLQSVAGTFRL